MNDRKPARQTLAAVLDHTQWDYSAAADRRFLLTSVERTFASVAWEISPQHLAPMAATATPGAPAADSAEFETQPLERLISDHAV
jgi:hypothetical protein